MTQTTMMEKMTQILKEITMNRKTNQVKIMKTIIIRKLKIIEKLNLKVLRKNKKYSTKLQSVER